MKSIECFFIMLYSILADIVWAVEVSKDICKGDLVLSPSFYILLPSFISLPTNRPHSLPQPFTTIHSLFPLSVVWEGIGLKFQTNATSMRAVSTY